MLKKIIYTVAFIIILVCSISYLTCIFIPKSDEFYTSGIGIYHEKDELDVVFIGSSHVIWGIDPNYIWEKTGMTSLDYGFPGLDIKNAYYGLKEVLKHKKPKVIVVDVFLLYNESDAVGVTNRMCNALPLSVNKIEMINSNTKLDTLSERMDYYFPLHLYHTRKLDTTDFTFKYSNLELGHHVSFNRLDSHFQYGDWQERDTLSKDEKSYFTRIVNLAKKENIAIIFTTIPHLSASFPLKSSWNSVEDFAKANNFTYLNLNKLEYIKSTGLNYNEDVNDDSPSNSHLNYFGARKISLFLADMIQKKYHIEDKRKNKKYIAWNENLKEYNQLIKKTNPFLSRGDRLKANERLTPTQYLTSPNDKYKLIFQKDGNLVLLDDKNQVVWSTNTFDKPCTECIMQDDGNFVMYDKDKNHYWATYSFDHPNSEFVVQNDGSVVVKNGDTIVWTSNKPTK